MKMKPYQYAALVNRLMQNTQYPVVRKYAPMKFATNLAAYHRQLFWREFWMWVALACVVTIGICFAL